MHDNLELNLPFQNDGAGHRRGDNIYIATSNLDKYITINKTA